MKANYWFFIPYLIFLVSGVILLIFNENGAENIFFNTHATRHWDAFFNYYTSVGEGWVLTAVVIALFFYRVRWALAAMVSLAASSLVVQVIKHVYANEFPRPRKFFEGTFTFRDIEGLNPHFWSSFPSGHTAAAFAVFSLLTFVQVKKSWGYTFFVLALLVGISRIYLAQHFLLDVLMGSVIGVLSGALAHYLFCRKGSFLDNKSWANRPLL